jgi:hypothetical protein
MKLTAMFKLFLIILIVSISSPVGAQEKAAKKEKKAKVSGIEAVISYVGQRTITYRYERKGKMREDVVGIDDQTYIERISREKISLKDLQKGDKVYILYEPNAYKPAKSVQVVGKEEMKKKAKKTKEK